MPYAQAVPNTPAIDRTMCMHFKTGGCKICADFCGVGAFDFNQEDETIELEVGAILLSPGFEAYDPSLSDTYGYNKSPNVVTSLEFERILAASGPYGGHLIRPSDGREPEKVAWLQCIGSRDVHAGSHPYCSAVCCTYAVKEAIVAKEHQKGKLDAAIFYIDMRTFGKDFERYYNRAKDENGVRFIKSKIANITEVNGSGNLMIRYTDHEGKRAEEEFDMVVLSVGLSASKESVELARKMDINLNSDYFVDNYSFSPVNTSRDGIFVSGCFQSPKDIPSSVTDASAAAAGASALLSESRFTLSKKRKVVPEIDIAGERPKIGVFVCRCGTNIASVVDVPSVAGYAKTLPFVEHVAENLFSCSQDTQENITRAITEYKLNRVVVAACTPQTHEPLFQETVRNAGINKYLFEMANIRNQCSWVHADFPDEATEKAKDLVRMAVEKVALLEPLVETEMEIAPACLVIGGGIAGMSAAKNLAEQGYKTYLVEKEDRLGGNGLSLYRTWQNEDIQSEIKNLSNHINAQERIEVFLKAEIKNVEGFVGNFTTTILIEGKEKALTHGVTIIATGASELKTDDYLYQKDSRVVTSLELNNMFIGKDKKLNDTGTCVFIQCVGSRIPERPYCSKVCCTHSTTDAICLKEMNPDMNVFILFRDMRTYGLRENLYREAREKGVIFIKYDSEKDLIVNNTNKELNIQFTDYALNRKAHIKADLLVLATAMVRNGTDSLSQFFKIPLNDDGFFVEAHVKLRPVDFATDGVFLCGLAHSPQPINESITQAQAAAARAVSLLANKSIFSSGLISEVNANYCSSCGVCVDICPFSAADFNEKTGKAEINPVLCKGCGLCVASCRSGAIRLHGFDEGQIMSMINQLNA